MFKIGGDLKMENVDTLSFGCLLTENEHKEQIIQQIKNKLKLVHTEEESCCYVGKYENKGYNFWFNDEYCCLIVTLEHKNIMAKTYKQIQKETSEDLNVYFELENAQIKIEKLNRIDFKNDFKYKNKQELKIIKYIIKTATDKISKNYKKQISEKDGFYKFKYSSEGSGYIEIVGYDKGKEMKKQYKKNKATKKENKEEIKKEIKKYKNTFRTEIRIKNGRLNYEKYKDGTSKDISNYYNVLVAKTYFDYYVTKILGKEKFYRIDKAIELIKQANELKNNMKEKLCNLIKDINENGYTKAKERYGEKRRKTFTAHLKKLAQLGINALTYATYIDGKKIEQESMENFGVMKDTATNTEAGETADKK